MGKMMNLDQVQNEINRQNELTLSITFSKNDLEQLWGICLSQSHWNKFVEKKQDQFRSQMTNEMAESEEYYMVDDDDDDSDDDDIHICGETGREYDPNPGMEQGCGVRCDDENGMIGNISYCVPCMEKYEPTGEMPTIFMDTTAVDAPKPKKIFIIKKKSTRELEMELRTKQLGF